MKKLFYIAILSLLFNEQTNAGWFDKKIKIDKCYDDEQYRSHKHQERNEGKKTWEWEIDLEKKVAIQTWGDNKRLDIAKHTVTIQTDKYLVARVSNPTAFQIQQKMVEVRFDLKNERVVSRVKDKFYTLQCDFN